MPAEKANAWHRWGSSGGSWGSSGGSSGSSGGSWGSSGGSWGSSGGSWGSSGGSWGSSGGSWGSSGGGWHHWSNGSHGSWGGSYSSGGSWGSHGSSGGSWGSHGSSGGDYYDYDESHAHPYDESHAHPAPPSPPPARGTAPEPKPEASTPPKGASYFSDPNSILISISVPDGAQVYVNGTLTHSTGSERTFVSRNLEPGRRYKYEVRAEVERNGAPASESKIVYVTAGDETQLAFATDAAQPAEKVASKPKAAEGKEAPASALKAGSERPPRTTLKLHVPQDAKVLLSGIATKSTGTVRIFSTDQLPAGKTWNDYMVRAEIEQGGRTVTRELNVSLKAGETREVTVDFDNPQVAATASSASR
jgi:uncharacterized protein (TIGR03000 family)